MSSRHTTLPEKFLNEAQRRDFERGRAEGMAKAKAKGRAEGVSVVVLKVLRQRGLTLTTEQRRRIVACTNIAVLFRWLDRSLSGASVDEILAVRSRKPPADRRSNRVAPAGRTRRNR